MPLTAGHSIKAVAEAIMEAMDMEVKEAMVDTAILLQSLMESIFLIPVIHLRDKNGKFWVKDVLLSGSCMSGIRVLGVDKDPLDMAAVAMVLMNVMLLLSKLMMPFIWWKLNLLTTRLTEVDIMDVDLGKGHMAGVGADSLGHW